MAKKPIEQQTAENNSMFIDLIKGADPKFADIDIPEVGFIDTGSFSLNALLSGSIWGGIAANRVTMFAGDPSTGKTFFSEAVARHFQKLNPKGGVIWWDTEFAQERAALIDKGMDPSRFIIRQPITIQDFRADALRFLKHYEDTPKSKRVPLMFALDSLGQLSTRKEIEDSEADNDTKDMTKQALIRATFRVLTNRLGMMGIPLVLTTHTYDAMSSYTPKEISGGGGGKYAASTIITFSKSAEKNSDKDVIGVIIKAKTYKSRYTREKQEVEIRLSFDHGLDRYWGLLDMAIDAKIWEKAAKGIQIYPGSEEKVIARKAIENNPKKYFTDEILARIETYVGETFKFGGNFTEDQAEHDFEDEVDSIVEEIDTNIE